MIRDNNAGSATEARTSLDGGGHIFGFQILVSTVPERTSFAFIPKFP
ncbi:MAG: hypothetical protein AAGL89_05045 [Pseudomonadota bacterium]